MGSIVQDAVPAEMCHLLVEGIHLIQPKHYGYMGTLFTERPLYYKVPDWFLGSFHSLLPTAVVLFKYCCRTFGYSASSQKRGVESHETCQETCPDYI